MKGLSVWIASLSGSSLLRVGMHTWQRSTGQIHVDIGSLGAALLGGICGSKSAGPKLSYWLPQGGMKPYPLQGCWHCSLRVGHSLPG